MSSCFVKSVIIDYGHTLHFTRVFTKMLAWLASVDKNNLLALNT